MKELSDLLAKDNPSELETELLNAIFQYSKGSLAKDISDKLIFILVGLESILLKTDNEPIQKSIGERIAALLGRTLIERKAVIKLITETYGIRSSFVHHGKKVTLDNTETLQKFMLVVWDTLYQIVQIVVKNPKITKEQFFNYLDDKRLSY